MVLTRAEFAALGEYSCSLPTGTTLGLRWKRNTNAYRPRPVVALHPFDGTPVLAPPWPPDWWMGEYVAHADPTLVGIVWARIELAAGAP